MEEISHYFCDYFFDLGLSDKATTFFNMLALLIILCIIIFVSDFIARKILVRAFNAYAKRSKSNFDDFLVSHNA
ncbi:MAG: mechanosensitive ion channel family protein, partial [Gelidibacter sp.]|nr:mechanosensitive ion channel family protein [Gelidibacter sp.]